MPGPGVDWTKYFKDRQQSNERPLKKARLEEVENPEQSLDGGSSASTGGLDIIADVLNRCNKHQQPTTPLNEQKEQEKEPTPPLDKEEEQPTTPSHKPNEQEDEQHKTPCSLYPSDAAEQLTG